MSKLTFRGGRPAIPETEPIPACTCCYAPMEFLFQAEFPSGHPWQAHVLAVFCCISCCASDTLIPQMLRGPLHGASIPDGFLTNTKGTFVFIVAEADKCEVRSDYDPTIEQASLKPIELRIGKQPKWLLGDETPGQYESLRPANFLLQLRSGTQFPRVAGAPLQKTLDLSRKPIDSDDPYYQLFIGNELYFFGFGSPSSDRVYLVTQVN